jgi:L-lysine exporter family protein LysE/ArgO
MLLSWLEGFMLGLGAAVPLGPINILMMNEALKEYKNGVFIGLGAMSADLSYLFLILFGLITYLNQPEILRALSLFGGVFLLYLSYSLFKARNRRVNRETPSSKSSGVKLYLKGFTLTFVNPYTVAFWLSVSGYIASKELYPFVTLFGTMSAILAWVTLMPYLVHKSKHRISQRVSYWITLLSATILLFFAIIMLLK